MNARPHIRPVILTLLLLVVFAAVRVPNDASGQGILPGWSPVSWFDWSDFRVDINGRVMLPRLTLGKFEGATLKPGDPADPNNLRLVGSDGAIDFRTDFGMEDDPSTIKSVQFTAYIDRLGLRICYDSGQIWTGRQDLLWQPQSVPGAQPPGTPLGTALVPVHVAVSAFDVESPRVGLDLDIIRYPFLRLGLDFDVNTSKVKFARVYWNDFFKTVQVNSSPQWAQNLPTPPVPSIAWLANNWGSSVASAIYAPTFIEYAESLQPITIGFHATAIPARVRDVPVILQGRFRFPVPFIGQIPALNREYEARIFDIELSGGLRPAVWETSLFGHSTFSVGIMAGYRWQYLEGQMVGHHWEWDTSSTTLNPWPTLKSWDKFDFKMKAAWHGAFIQLKAGF